MFLLLVCLAVGFSQAQEKLTASGDRLLVTVANVESATNDLESVLDPHHNKMIATGRYNATDADALRQAAADYFLSQFGLNFLAGLHDPQTDAYYLPVAGMFPYSGGYDNTVHLEFDSQYKQRGKKGTWYGYQYGEVVGMFAAGTFPGGVMNGTHYAAGDLLSYFHYDFVNLEKPSQYETILCYSAWPTKQPINSFGITESFAKLEVVDSNGNVGFFSEDIHNIVNPQNTSQVEMRIRGVFTIPYSVDDTKE